MPAKRKKSMKEPAGAVVYELKITLAESDPPIWRRLQVSGGITLGELNYILQVVMGWTNSHLHQFTVGDARYSDPRFELDEYDSDVTDEFSVTLAELAPKARSRFLFEYDFGDGWEHEVVVEKTLPADPETSYPICLAGERACPPEDCGGVWGYKDFLEAISDPTHEEHDSMLEWVGGDFDAESFDLDDLNARLTEDVKLYASWT